VYVITLDAVWIILIIFHRNRATFLIKKKRYLSFLPFTNKPVIKVISFGKQNTKETLETRIWNPATFGPWNPESRREIRNPRTWNPESTSWNPESKALLDYLTWADIQVMTI